MLRCRTDTGEGRGDGGENWEVTDENKDQEQKKLYRNSGDSL